MKVKLHCETHLTQTDRRLLTEMGKAIYTLKPNLHYGYSKRKRAHVKSITGTGTGYLVDVRIIDNETNDYGEKIYRGEKTPITIEITY